MESPPPEMESLPMGFSQTSAGVPSTSRLSHVHHTQVEKTNQIKGLQEDKNEEKWVNGT